MIINSGRVCTRNHWSMKTVLRSYLFAWVGAKISLSRFISTTKRPLSSISLRLDLQPISKIITVRLAVSSMQTSPSLEHLSKLTCLTTLEAKRTIRYHLVVSRIVNSLLLHQQAVRWLGPLMLISSQTISLSTSDLPNLSSCRNWTWRLRTKRSTK